jgi:quinol monooxygenase YgiN
MPLVSVTRLRVRLWRYLPAFLLHTFRAARQIRRAEGNLSFSLLNDARHTFWTLSVWHDEAAMRAFMLSGAHREAMPHFLEWCDEAALVHWTQESEEPPVWAEAHRRLRQQGRLSKVNHPSVAHTRFEIPAPRPRARTITISRV